MGNATLTGLPIFRRLMLIGFRHYDTGTNSDNT